MKCFALLARGTAIGLAGGSLFYLIGLPLPWVLGAMAATIAAGAAGVEGYMPRSVRNAVIPALGVTFGSAFDTEIFKFLPDFWLLVPMILVYLAMTIGGGCYYFSRLARLDITTAYFASVPGSFSEMLFVAEDMKADLRSVAVVHSTRLVISLTLITTAFRLIFGVDTTDVPSISDRPLTSIDAAILFACAVIGYFGGRAVRLPSAHMFGPLILSAAAHLTGFVDGAPPEWMIALVQVFIGIFIGIRFAGVRFSAVRRLLVLSCVWAIVLLVFALLLAELALMLLDLPLEAGFLSFAPGGAVEISVIALAAGVSLSLVTVIQLIRVTLTVLLVPFMTRFFRFS